MSASKFSSRRFLPTPSARRATEFERFKIFEPKISTHALREEGDRQRVRTVTNGRSISTHALREEGDKDVVDVGSDTVLISTHALREEGDRGAIKTCPRRGTFLPTPSARRATQS